MSPEWASESRSVVSNFLRPHGLVHGILQARILEWVAFPFSRGSSQPRSLTLQQILYQLSHKGSPRILKWVAYPFSSGSSWPRNQTGVSCISGGFFTNWATREAHKLGLSRPTCHTTLKLVWKKRFRPCFGLPGWPSRERWCYRKFWIVISWDMNLDLREMR